MKPRTLAFLLFGIYVLLTMCSCAHHKLVAPSASRVTAHVGNAQKANTEAQRYNDVNRTLAERIDAKTAVILKYSK